MKSIGSKFDNVLMTYKRAKWSVNLSDNQKSRDKKDYNRELEKPYYCLQKLLSTVN